MARRPRASACATALKGHIMPVRPYVAGYYQLVLDGIACGFMKSIEGGAATAEVVSEPGPTYFAKKHLGPLSYHPLVMEFGLGMTNDLYHWINASWSGSYSRKSGAVVAIDQRFVAVSQREFFNALITEVTFPKLDASSKEPAYLTLKCAPEYTRTGKASGGAAPVAKADQKAWLTSNFRVTIDGLDCKRVSAVESFTVKQSVVRDDIGDARDYLKVPGRLEFPNLTISVAESSAKSWYDWFDDFVIKGNCDDSREKSGSISVLAANLTDEQMRIDLFNVGIFSLASDKRETSAETVATVTAQLYCERMELNFGGSAAAGVASAKVPRLRKAKSKRRR
jgi:hypothetical protein